MQKEQEKQGFREYDVASLIEPAGSVRIAIPESSIVELAESMKEVGLIQPIVISEQEGQYEIVVGHRRWLAAKRLGWEKIDGIVRKLTRLQIALIRATENLQREGLTYIEEAAVYKDLQENHNLSLRQIADRVGKTHTTVENRIALLEMDAQVQRAVHEKKIGPSVAVELNKIDNEKDLDKYLGIAINSGVTAKVLSEWVEDRKRGLGYSSDKVDGGSPPLETKREQKYFKMCQLCEGPKEYKDMLTLEVCSKCHELTLKVADKGYFKEGGK